MSPASRVLVPAAAAAEVKVSALTGRAQAAMEIKSWEVAEDALSEVHFVAEDDHAARDGTDASQSALKYSMHECSSSIGTTQPVFTRT